MMHVQKEQATIHQLKPALCHTALAKQVKCHSAELFWYEQLEPYSSVRQLVGLQSWKTAELTCVCRHHSHHLQGVKYRPCQGAVWWSGIPTVCCKHPVKGLTQLNQVLNTVDPTWLLKELSAVMTCLQLVNNATLPAL